MFSSNFIIDSKLSLENLANLFLEKIELKFDIKRGAQRRC